MKPHVASRIFYITLTIAILGLSFELVQAFVGPSLFENSVLTGFRAFTLFIDLNFFRKIQFFIAGKHGIAPLNILFYSLLLAGTYQFRKSSYKHFRLISFCLLILMIYSALCLPFLLYNIAKLPGTNVTIIFIRCSGTLVFSLWALRQISVSSRFGPSDATSTVEAPRVFRFLHSVIDSLLIVIIFTPLMSDFFATASDLFGEYGIPTLIITQLILAKLFYYLVSESTVYTTPAKYLTGCYVLSTDHGKPTLGSIIKRTLCRFVPLDSVTFFGSSGIHDQISNTQVVKASHTIY